MKKKFAAGAIALLSLASPFAATVARADQAQRWPLWYVGISGGVDFLSDSDIKGSDSGKLRYGDGGVGTVSLGYMPPFTAPFFNGLRIEAELGYHDNSLDSVSLRSSPSTSSNGSIHTASYMGNLYYDLRNSSSLTPYIGAGAGGAQVHLDRTSGLNNTNDNDSVFAYQFMGGVAYSPSSIPMTQWTLGYRYFATEKPEYATAGGRDRLDGYDAQSVELGAKFRF